jgi:protein-tyrosine phosphatase
MNTVLFLCSGNYYRSRFAEHLFNWLAEHSRMPWRAESRGLAVGMAGNIGAISQFAVEGLRTRGVALSGHWRLPQQVSEADFVGAAMVIAVKEAEHRPAMAKLFPHWAHRIQYWQIDDLDCAEAEQALALLEKEVQTLLIRLRG